MRFYYYKDDNKKEIRKIDRDNICEDINKKAKQWSRDVEEVREDYDRVVREIYPSANKYYGKKGNRGKQALFAR